MIRKAFSLLATLFLLQLLLVSCFKQQKCKGRLIEAHCAIASELPFPNFYSPNSDSIFVSHFDSLTISNQLFGEQFECNYAKLQSMFINSCYAFKQGPPEITFVDRIDSIHMTTVNDYNATHLAGSSIENISDYSLTLTNNSIWSSQPLSQIKTELNTILSNFTSYTNQSFLSRLTQKPSQSGDTIQIAIAIFLNTGNTLRDTSSGVVIKY